MSTHDGTPNEDAYCPLPSAVGVDVAPQVLAQRINATGPAPPQTLLMGSPFMASQTHPRQQQHHHQQPLQQHYNEYFYNLYATQPGQPETYSVLPVGHGNFLKVYHCQENAAATGLPTESSAALYHAPPQSTPPAQQFQHQAQATFHMRQVAQTQPPPPPQFFNSYELFSSNTLMPTPDNQTTLGRNEIKAPTMQVTQQAPVFMLNNHDETVLTQTATTSSTNMIINKLVNNWSPKVTGAPIQQLPMQSATPLLNPETANAVKDSEITQVGFLENRANNSEFSEEPIQIATATPILSQPMPVLPITQVPPNDMPSNEDQNNSKEAASDVANALPGSTVTPQATTSHINNAPEVKKRIVAEVKPMRMSYSDVLSKINNQQSTTAQSHNSNKQALSKNGKPTSDRKAENRGVTETGAVGASIGRRPLSVGEDTIGQSRSCKKSPIHENKENLQQSLNGKNNRRSNNNSNSAVITNMNTSSSTQQKQGQKINQKPIVVESSTWNGINGINKNGNSLNGKKRISSKRIETDTNKLESSVNKNQKINGANSDRDFNVYYNVTAKNNDTTERASRTTNNGFVPASNNPNTATTTTRKSNKFSASFYSNSNSSSFNTNQSRTRYGNANSNSSYSYSSKRSRNTNSYSNTSAGSSNRNYELAKKFLQAWLEYTIMILTWLFYLVYDIVVLGCSVAYDRLIHACECAIVYAKQLRQDFKQNSNKPSIWLKNYWRRFDARFKKNSQWAFWRRFYQKKPPEPTADSTKSGRLPQTGEEAMYSLLNCKGKDAYSILGVPPDCSQEQIRKHYKKIAVLVHPDKNKQAGAEEAFKVLQRAFELIGEPEKRLAYDQSLAEALHAEKAWTELHDLLSQLQTKITEAANTIRCSTCGLRHPRRLTDRPHYAARECASCKIRHSAREGDIWAETSMLGLRWRYLALMEGKVYDITEWANCQKGALSHLEPNSHMVQYRIVRGAQQQQQQQQNQQQQPSFTHPHHSPHHQNPQQPYSQQPGSHHERNGSGKFKRNVPPSEASLHEFLDNLYSGQHPNPGTSSAAYSNPSRRRARRN